MEQIFQIDHQLQIPIYQQLVDSIRSAIIHGTLSHGQRLPTVQEVSQKLSIARGTIKRVYDELEILGFVEKAQGRGTFVSYQRLNPESRKDRALVAIDQLLEELEAMGLSPGEINIFLNLKLRERAEQQAPVKMAFLESSPECISQISRQLGRIPQTELYTELLSNVIRYPYRLAEDLDLIVTTAQGAQELRPHLPAGKRIILVALRPDPQCMGRIIKLRPGQKVGFLCASAAFGSLLQQTCSQYAEDAELAEPLLFGDETMRTYAARMDAVLVPEGYEKYCTPLQAEVLRSHPGLLPCSYELDEGSYLYLQEKTKRIMEAKSL